MHKLVERVVTIKREELLEIDVSEFLSTHVDDTGNVIVDWYSIREVIIAHVLARVTNLPPATSVGTQLTWDDQGYHIHMAWVEWQDAEVSVEELIKGD